jgi:TolB-like protein
MSSKLSLWAELRRRKVVRVAVVYAATVFAVVQAADIMLPRLGVPDWAVTLVVALSVLGFPIALVLAWALELTPDGVRVTTSQVEADPANAPSLLGRRTVLAAAALVVLGVGLGAGWFLRPATPFEVSHEASSDAAATTGTEVTAKSVAVLPFADMSDTGDQAWFVDGLTEEILNSLARLPELMVTARTSSFQFREPDRDIRAIAGALGVANVVEGSVRRIGERLRVTAQLIRATDGFHLWSDTYDRNAEDLFEVQRDVAEKIAATLDVFLDEARRDRMFASGTRNVAAFEQFQKGRVLFQDAHAGVRGADLAAANVHFERAMALDPAYAQAARFHSDLYAHLAMDGPERGTIALGDIDLSSQEAIERLRADLAFAAAHASDPIERAVDEINLAFLSSWHRMPGLLATIAAASDGELPSMEGTLWLHMVLHLVGDLDTLRRFAAKHRQVDPLDPVAWNYLVDIEIHAGNFDAARALLAEGRRNAGDHRWMRGNDLILAREHGDRATVMALLETRLGEAPHFPALLAAVRGDRDTALRLAGELDNAGGWPNDALLEVYHEIGDAERSRALVRRVDALPAGAAILSRRVFLSGGTLPFDLAAAPNFTARLAEAGIDLSRLPNMTRLSVVQEPGR